MVQKEHTLNIIKLIDIFMQPKSDKKSGETGIYKYANKTIGTKSVCCNYNIRSN